MDPLNKQVREVSAEINNPQRKSRNNITKEQGGGGSKPEAVAGAVLKGLKSNSSQVTTNSLVNRVSQPSSAPLQILKAKNGFYVGCLLPEELTSQGKDALKIILNDQNIELSPRAQAHITVIPPSERLKPQINIGEYFGEGG